MTKADIYADLHNPANQLLTKPTSIMSTNDTNSSSSAWTLYYNDDNYPYYYNHITGESKWAEYSDAPWAQTPPTDNNADDQGEHQTEDDDSESDSGSEPGSSAESDSELDAGEAERFEEFLKSGEGQAMLEVCLFAACR
jgi:hypothetical protein